MFRIPLRLALNQKSTEKLFQQLFVVSVVGAMNRIICQVFIFLRSGRFLSDFFFLRGIFFVVLFNFQNVFNVTKDLIYFKLVYVNFHANLGEYFRFSYNVVGGNFFKKLFNFVIIWPVQRRNILA